LYIVYFISISKILLKMTSRLRTLDDYKKAYQLSVDAPEAFWAEQADSFVWHKKWDKVLNWNFEGPDVKWFDGGKLNITENCLDRHLETRADKTAILWVANDPNTPAKKITYRELYHEVNVVANGLKAKGIKKGDRVVFYMPMVPELAIGVLACARIGAIHSVVFAGFSAQSLAQRVDDAEAKMIICSDHNYRGNKDIPVKKVVDDAMKMGCASVENVIVHKNTGKEVEWTANDVWWHDMIKGMSNECPAEVMDSEDTLFILYTSGSTGKPKGVVHTIAGYMVYTAYTFKNIFQYDEDDIYWCTADIGWITGHSYIVYGPLLEGATTMMFEGVPTYPDAGRFWEVVEKYKVNQFYTAPTAIRALMAAGEDIPDKYDLSSLKVLGSVGEPINVEAWNWYNVKIGREKCPIVDTWWQTETGGVLITPLPGITDTKPSYASYPMPGVQPVLLDTDGNLLEGNDVEGLLCIKFPWPGILRTTWGDHARCRQTYFSSFKDLYFTGDGAKRDSEGRIRIIGRVDDVLNVSGHRLGTAEIENAINLHKNVVESAIVGFPHDIKGQGIYAYVITNHLVEDEEAFKKEIVDIVRREIGPIAKPDVMQIVPGLPKTRSGKIMRRILRKVASSETDQLGDTSTLLNPEVVEAIKEGAENLKK
jgi:acetyl-CoA synthetase